MHQHDVIIVGGGPSGSTLAWALRQQGMNIAIIDKQHFPRDKVCAGWVTPAVLESLEIDIDEYQQQNTMQAIHGFRLGRLSGRHTDIDYPDNPVSYAIRRCEFDHYLLKRSGATLYPDTKVSSLRFVNGNWDINRSFTAPLLVGAGGHFCPVARHIGAKLGKAEIAVSAQEIEFEMTEQQQKQCRVSTERPELYFCDDLKGYGWVVRKQAYLNVGLGREDNSHLSQHVSSFCRQLKALGRIPADTPEKFHGHAYLCYPQAKRPLLDDGVILIGDAAGLAYPESGEGIRPAIESALLAAQVIAGSKNHYTKEVLSPYKKLLEGRFGRRASLNVSTQTNTFITAVKVSIGKVLLASQWFNKHIVLNRWFLHQQQAPLLMQDRQS